MLYRILTGVFKSIMDSQLQVLSAQGNAGRLLLLVRVRMI
jgi:hypothetical protein